MRITQAALYVVKFVLCVITLFGSYACLYAAQELAWPWPWTNLLNNFFVTFQKQFPIFMFGLINPGAPLQLRAAALLLIASFFFVVLALYRIQAKGNRSFIMLCLLLFTSYGLYVWAKGFDLSTLQIAGKYVLVLFLFAFIGRWLQSKISVSKRFDKA